MSATFTVQVPAGAIRNVDIGNTAGIEDHKVHQRIAYNAFQDDSGDVASADYLFGPTAGQGGRIIGLRVKVLTAPDGGDKQYTIDLEKAASGSASFSGVMTRITIDSSNGDGDVVDGVITSPELLSGDTLKLSITASGSTGDQGVGVSVEVLTAHIPSVPQQ